MTDTKRKDFEVRVAIVVGYSAGKGPSNAKLWLRFWPFDWLRLWWDVDLDNGEIEIAVGPFGLVLDWENYG